MQAHQDRLEPIAASDEEIRAALEHADTHALMLAMVHITGDMDIIRGDIQPTREFLSADDGLTDEQREAVKKQALTLISQYRDNPGELFKPTDDELLEMLRFLTGEDVTENYAEFLTSELSMNGEDPYKQPEIFEVPEVDRADFKVLVIGAGMSGLLSAIRLQEAGINFQVVEKNTDVGGTWFENTYPGCRVDSANHTYSYSFRPQDWPQHYSQQEVLRQYFADTANEFGLRQHIRFDTEVVEARFDKASGTWQVTVQNNGKTETISANAIISAVGQLNRPNMPDFEGTGSFTGPTFHSAQWEHEHDLTGKRVGVIGTGASAFQFAPIVSEQASQVTLFQRTPPWIVPNENYFQYVPTEKHWLLRHVPFYARWFRFSVFWRSAEGLLHAVTAEEGWNRPEESVGPTNQMFREVLIMNLQAELAGHDDLIEKCTPHYPPGAKRALIDDGRYLRTLKKDNVDLVTDPIERITPTGVQTLDGTHHEFDVLIYGTGFKASDFLFPMKIYGADGEELHDAWGDRPQAYKGITIPGFPNFFCCYGPNTNIVVNGSIVFFSECEVRYILGCIAMLLRENSRAIDVKQEVHDRYNEWIDLGNANMAWGQSNVNTWYKNKEGKITQNWPFTLREFWEMTRSPDPQDYELS